MKKIISMKPASYSISEEELSELNDLDALNTLASELSELEDFQAEAEAGEGIAGLMLLIREIKARLRNLDEMQRSCQELLSELQWEKNTDEVLSNELPNKPVLYNYLTPSRINAILTTIVEATDTLDDAIGLEVHKLVIHKQCGHLFDEESILKNLAIGVGDSFLCPQCRGPLLNELVTASAFLSDISDLIYISPDLIDSARIKLSAIGIQDADVKRLNLYLDIMRPEEPTFEPRLAPPWLGFIPMPEAPYAGRRRGRLARFLRRATPHFLRRRFGR